MKEWFEKHKILITVGTGGVGKTTLSAVLGLQSARLGRKTLVLTIDPARRLAQALGLNVDHDHPVEIPGFEGRLHALMIHPQSIFDEFVRQSAKSFESAERLIANRLYQELSTTLGGSQEFTSLERLLQAVESGAYDTIILDTPPAQHAADFLKAPEKIYSLFNSQVTRWMSASSQERNILQKFLQKGTLTAISALKKLTGQEFIRELKDFFITMGEFQEKVRDRALGVHKMLNSEETGFVLVTSNEGVKLKQSLDYVRSMRKEGRSFCGLFVNRVIETPKGNLTEAHSDQEKDFLKRFEVYQTERQIELRDFIDKMEGVSLSLTVPDLPELSAGLEGLIEISEHVNAKGTHF